MGLGCDCHCARRDWLFRASLVAFTSRSGARCSRAPARAASTSRGIASDDGSSRARHASLGPYEVALECSDILRRYIEGRFALPIRFQTTREFLGAAQSEPLLGPEPRRELGEFLNFFDRLKFARDTAHSSETLAAIDGAERFIRRCIPEEKTSNDKT